MDGSVNAKLRKVIFWLHLTAGLVAGLVIAIMCFTGAALAFEKDIIAWAERDVRRVTPPSPGDTRPIRRDTRRPAPGTVRRRAPKLASEPVRPHRTR